MYKCQDKIPIREYRQKLGLNRYGLSPENSMCEGFLETIKNEFFYPNDWKYTTCDDFITELEKYLIWFKKND